MANSADFAAWVRARRVIFIWEQKGKSIERWK